MSTSIRVRNIGAVFSPRGYGWIDKPSELPLSPAAYMRRRKVRAGMPGIFAASGAFDSAPASTGMRERVFATARAAACTIRV